MREGETLASDCVTISKQNQVYRLTKWVSETVIYYTEPNLYIRLYSLFNASSIFILSLNNFNFCILLQFSLHFT